VGQGCKSLKQGNAKAQRTAAKKLSIVQ